jgi:hypothetical protein
MQSTLRNSMLDALIAEAQLEELPARNDSVLPSGQSPRSSKSLIV